MENQKKSGAVILVSAFTIMVMLFSANFNSASATAQIGGTSDNGRPLMSDGCGNYCCENSGTDCGAVCCA